MTRTPEQWAKGFGLKTSNFWVNRKRRARDLCLACGLEFVPGVCAGGRSLTLPNFDQAVSEFSGSKARISEVLKSESGWTVIYLMPTGRIRKVPD